MTQTRENRNNRGKPLPVPQTPHAPACDRTRASAMTDQRQTAAAKALSRPTASLCTKVHPVTYHAGTDKELTHSSTLSSTSALDESG